MAAHRLRWTNSIGQRHFATYNSFQKVGNKNTLAMYGFNKDGVLEYTHFELVAHSEQLLNETRQLIIKAQNRSPRL